MSGSKKPYHMGEHDRLAKLTVRAANHDPNYTCPTCCLTRAQGIALWGTNGVWEGGHRVHGSPAHGYHAQHRHCNRSEGAAHGNAMRTTEPHSERW